VLDTDDPGILRSISDASRLQPADETLRNLLGTLSGKLDLCARLPFLAYEADREGYNHVAAAFRQLAVTERRSLDLLLDSLRLHLEGSAARVPAKGAR
jgi:rubrerythrin